MRPVEASAGAVGKLELAAVARIVGAAAAGVSMPAAAVLRAAVVVIELDAVAETGLAVAEVFEEFAIDSPV